MQATMNTKAGVERVKEHKDEIQAAQARYILANEEVKSIKRAKHLAGFAALKDGEYYDQDGKRVKDPARWWYIREDQLKTFLKERYKILKGKYDIDPGGPNVTPEYEAEKELRDAEDAIINLCAEIVPEIAQAIDEGETSRRQAIRHLHSDTRQQIIKTTLALDTDQ